MIVLDSCSTILVIIIIIVGDMDLSCVNMIISIGIFSSKFSKCIIYMVKCSKH